MSLIKRGVLILVLIGVLFSSISYSDEATGAGATAQAFFYDTGWIFRQQMGGPFFKVENPNNNYYSNEDIIKPNAFATVSDYKEIIFAEKYFKCNYKEGMFKSNPTFCSSVPYGTSIGFGDDGYMTHGNTLLNLICGDKVFEKYKGEEAGFAQSSNRGACCSAEQKYFECEGENSRSGYEDQKSCETYKISAEQCWNKAEPINSGSSFFGDDDKYTTKPEGCGDAWGILTEAYYKNYEGIRGEGRFDFNLNPGVTIPTIEVVSCIVSGEAKLKMVAGNDWGDWGAIDKKYGEIADFDFMVEGAEPHRVEVGEGIFVDNSNLFAESYETYSQEGKDMCPLAVYGANEASLESAYPQCEATKKIVYPAEGQLSLLADVYPNEEGRNYLRCLLRVSGAQVNAEGNQVSVDFYTENITIYPNSERGNFLDKFTFQEEEFVRWIDGILYPVTGGTRGGGSGVLPSDPNAGNCISCAAGGCDAACIALGANSQGWPYVKGYCAKGPNGEGDECCICIPEDPYKDNCGTCLADGGYSSCNEWCVAGGYVYGRCAQTGADHGERCCACWGQNEICNYDGTCSEWPSGLKETYESCPFDCSEGGKEDCVISYDCTSWSDCDSNDMQTRTCEVSSSDLNYYNACINDGRGITGDNALTRSCDGNVNCVDEDGDGEEIEGDGCSRGTDCDDTDADINSAAEEVCGNNIDDDCDGSIDENCVSECTNGEQQECGVNEGECRKGIQVCVNGIWSVCGGSDYVGPVSESCNGLDDDCDGYIDDNLDDCTCVSGEEQECGTDVGECQKGVTKCVDGVWGRVCEGEIGPVDEICDDGKDNDCDGKIDDLDSECSGGSSVFKKKETCYDGIKNQDETGIDCGGVCKSCETDCGNGKISSKCRCGLRLYTTGYCCDGIYQLADCEFDDGDSDDDGWQDTYELEVGTNPLNQDTDFDEFIDSIDDNPLCNNDGKCDDSGTYPEKNCNDCSSNWWIWLLLIIVLIAGGCLVYYLFFMKKKPVKKKNVIRPFKKKSFVVAKSKESRPLNEYVRKSLKAGKKVSEIELSAVNAGWKRSEVRKAINSIKR